tara:strand:+ start:12014 stop:12211 length:198 start_codon:yes stop_codon:yes gene_type:complete
VTDFAINHLDYSVDILTHTQIVSDHNASVLLLMNKISKNLHDLIRTHCIQVGSWLISENNAGFMN